MGSAKIDKTFSDYPERLRSAKHSIGEYGGGIMLKYSLMLGALLLAGCAKSPNAIIASDVSTTGYEAWSCDQLRVEDKRIENQLAAASAAQSQAATNDSLGVFLIGLPVASMSGSDREAEISRMKGERAAMGTVQARKACR